MVMQNGLNPAAIPVSCLSSYVQTLPTLQDVAQTAEDGPSDAAWWEGDR